MLIVESVANLRAAGVTREQPSSIISTMLQLLIHNARIIDGTGSPWFRGSVLVEDNTLTIKRGEIDLDEYDSERVIDAEDNVVCPGFAADCLETIDEIGRENREEFEKAGGGSYRYIPALNDRNDHAALLAGLVEREL